MGPYIDPTIMLSIYHVHVAIMLSYGNRVIQISISFLFAEIILFFLRNSFIITYILKFTHLHPIQGSKIEKVEQKL